MNRKFLSSFPPPLPLSYFLMNSSQNSCSVESSVLSSSSIFYLLWLPSSAHPAGFLFYFFPSSLAIFIVCYRTNRHWDNSLHKGQIHLNPFFYSSFSSIQFSGAPGQIFSYISPGFLVMFILSTINIFKYSLLNKLSRQFLS